MTELVNKLVKLSRMDEENYKLEIIKLQFSEILKDIISEFKYILNIKEIQLITNIDDNIYINANEILITKLIY